MRKEIYLAGGCFWGTEKYLSLIKGVCETEVGYANGKTACPSYEDVCYRNTGHAEAVKVVYDDSVISLPYLLSLFYKVIDPTTLNKQGNDVGTQYRTGVYYADAGDKEVIEASVAKLQSSYDRRIMVEAAQLENFYAAEEYHRKYLDKHPGGYCHIGSEAFDLAKNAADPALNKTYTKKTKEQLKAELLPLQFQVTQEAATEPPFENEYYANDREGIYVDITTGQPLFLSKDKFDAGCGWPSFSRPIDETAVKEKQDLSHFMIRTEVRSKIGDAHLGHLFNDGPQEAGGLRYCINSASLRFIPKEDMEKEGYGKYLEK